MWIKTKYQVRERRFFLLFPSFPRQPRWHPTQVPGPPENEVFHIASTLSDQATNVYIHIFIYAHIYKYKYTLSGYVCAEIRFIFFCFVLRLGVAPLWNQAIQHKPSWRETGDTFISCFPFWVPTSGCVVCEPQAEHRGAQVAFVRPCLHSWMEENWQPSWS